MPNKTAVEEIIPTQLVVCFSAQAQEVAVAVDQVQEIVEVHDLTTVPSSDPRLLGFATLRGHLVPLLGLRTAMGLLQSESAPAPPFMAVILLVDGESVAVRCDAVPTVANTTSMMPNHLEPMKIGEEIRSFINTNDFHTGTRDIPEAEEQQELA